ncbi:MAG: hypothetical protein KDD66_02645 [Bdellovibrionales bacterium]|nr:hypothetical protein [Bdellovibrionales bacterium]
MNASDIEKQFEEFERFIDDFVNESERAAVVIGCAKLDSLLLQILSKVLIAPTTADDPFLEGGTAPLGTFSSRINACYRIGLIDAPLSRALHLLRKIRNDFAHESFSISLAEPRYTDRVRELIAPFKDGKEFTYFRRTYFYEDNNIVADFLTALSMVMLRLNNLLEIAKSPSCIPLATIVHNDPLSRLVDLTPVDLKSK